MEKQIESLYVSNLFSSNAMAKWHTHATCSRERGKHRNRNNNRHKAIKSMQLIYANTRRTKTKYFYTHTYTKGCTTIINRKCIVCECVFDIWKQKKEKQHSATTTAASTAAAATENYGSTFICDLCAVHITSFSCAGIAQFK